jgi:RNA polymerase-binding transcription factor DksA
MAAFPLECTVPDLTDDDILQFEAQLRRRRDTVLAASGQLQIEADELKDIDAALARIGSGTFGGCAKCGARISLKRLHAQPGARVCLSCQEALERHRLPPAG